FFFGEVDGGEARVAVGAGELDGADAVAAGILADVNAEGVRAVGEVAAEEIAAGGRACAGGDDGEQRVGGVGADVAGKGVAGGAHAEVFETRGAIENERRVERLVDTVGDGGRERDDAV